MEDRIMIDIGQAAAAASSRELLNLPHEILQTFLEHCQPDDLGRLASTCCTLRDFIRNNELLWKSVYLKSFDEPRPDADELQWMKAMQDLVVCQKYLDCEDRSKQRAGRACVANAIIKLLKTMDADDGRSRNLGFLRLSFGGEIGKRNQDTFLCGSSLFGLCHLEEGEDGCVVAETETDQQLLAQLHCLYGAPRRGWGTGSTESDTHPYARARVYDLDRYTDNTKWGPFKDDEVETVDWEKLESIITVLGYNLKLFSDQTNRLFPEQWTAENGWVGASPFSFVTPKKDAATELRQKLLARWTDDFLSEEDLVIAAKDPYGVTGTWHRIVCFLDYYDFHTFNFRTEERDYLDHEEATRLIMMRFKVTDIQYHDNDKLPTVRFRGDSRAMAIGPGDQNANSAIIGKVRPTRDGEIRWTTWSVYDGEERWRSEGIQIGGIQSGRGVIGNWFDKDKDPHGPAGPTAFWKVSNEA